ncbi:MAG: type 1 glutamine amidotransferase [Candidatus Methylacidiphilales bacterium]
MHIHYLQHVPFEGPAGIESWAMRQNHVLSATRLYNNEPLPSLSNLEVLILLGGPMNIDEDKKYPWLTPEKQLIEQAIQQDKTVIGICLGAQLIAEVLGARVYRAPHQEMGWFPIDMTDEAVGSPVFAPLPKKLTVFHWHGDTFDLPQAATHLASSTACANQAFSLHDKVVGLQFHLESTPESVRQLLHHGSDELQEGSYVQKAEDMLPREREFGVINKALEGILDRLLLPYSEAGM